MMVYKVFVDGIFLLVIKSKKKCLMIPVGISNSPKYKQSFLGVHTPTGQITQWGKAEVSIVQNVMIPGKDETCANNSWIYFNISPFFNNLVSIYTAKLIKSKALTSLACLLYLVI